MHKHERHNIAFASSSSYFDVPCCTWHEYHMCSTMSLNAALHDMSRPLVNRQEVSSILNTVKQQSNNSVTLAHLFGTPVDN